MPKFKITGVNIRTGEVTGMDIDAESAEQARAVAGQRGLRHIAMVPVREDADRTAPESAEKKSTQGPK